VQQVAVFAAVTSSTSDPDGADRYEAIAARVSANLDGQPGMQRIVDITSDLASAQATMQQARQRHVETKSTIADMLQHIEGVPQEQVAAEILALNTRLQASLQTTAMLYQTSLVNYL
jgi:flagellar hook-associated protein 3 FlgL